MTSDLSPAAEALIDELAKLRHLEMCRVKIGGRCGCGLRPEARALLAAYTAKVREEDAALIAALAETLRAVNGWAEQAAVGTAKEQIREWCASCDRLLERAAIRARGGEEHHGA